MPKKLSDRIQAHRDDFEERYKKDDYSAWFLHAVVFPSLKDIAEEMDRLSARLDARAKGTGRG